MRLAFFGYAWNRALQVDAYMAETIASLAQTGASVDVYLGNQLSKEYGIYGRTDTFHPERLARFIAAAGYDAAISFNNSMLIPEVCEAITGRIVTVIVDAPEHLFDYDRTGPFETFRRDVEIVAMSSDLERRIVEEVDGARPRLHFMLPATQIGPAEASDGPIHPISWVSSYVGDSNLDQYFQLMAERPDFRALTIDCLAMIERDGDLRAVRNEDGPAAALIRSLPWPFEYFQTQLQNILTNRGRVAIVERLSAHGLALFGNSGWQKLLGHNAAVLASLQSGPPPVSHTDLQRIYNASRISINLPQVHVAQDAVQYRVIDVMASNALCITKHSPTSDLYRVFGADCPVPTYTDLDELEQLCARYLQDEPARSAIVAECNSLVASGFSFADRAADLLRIAGLEPRAKAPAGQAHRIDLRPFTT